MQGARQSRLLGLGITLLVGGALALTACNSNSSSSTTSDVSKVTNAEAKSPAPSTSGPRSQGIVGAAISKTR